MRVAANREQCDVVSLVGLAFGQSAELRRHHPVDDRAQPSPIPKARVGLAGMWAGPFHQPMTTR